MSYLNVVLLLGGLAMFLFGMNIMGDGLEKLGGGKLEKTLERLTSSVLKGVLLGAGVTAVIQSSSATTVMVVGFVNSGIMKLGQAIGVIMGANIGTTVTAWLLSLTGIESDSLSLLKPEYFSCIFAFIGIALIMFSKSQAKKDIGNILIGFTVLIFGMGLMSDSVAPLAGEQWFKDLFIMFSNNPILGILAGAVLTGIIQSSSASVGILQAISKTGVISFASAFPIVLGQNIGTCATALISCIGAKKNAKRAALIHLYFNIMGVIILSLLFYTVNAFMQFDFVKESINEVGIATIHTCFNLAATAILLPFNKLIVKLAEKTIRDDKFDRSIPFVDERFLNTPAIAVDQCAKLTLEMAQLTKETISKAFGLVYKYDDAIAQDVKESEARVDVYEDVLGKYLVKLSSKGLNIAESREVTRLLQSIGDFERISDHAVNVLTAAKEMYTKRITFSQSAKDELRVMIAAVEEVLDITITAFESRDIEIAKCVEPLEQVVDDLKIKLKAHHIERLQRSDCTIELGFIFSDLLTSAERISDHCSNIAVYMIDISINGVGTHEYLKDLREKEPLFEEKYNQYKEQYKIPSLKKQLVNESVNS